MAIWSIVPTTWGLYALKTMIIRLARHEYWNKYIYLSLSDTACVAWNQQPKDETIQPYKNEKLTFFCPGLYNFSKNLAAILKH
jgi:hypothetical protein